MRLRALALAPIIALGALAATAPVVIADDAEPAARPQPRPSRPAAPTPKGLTKADEERLALAQAKRARKAAKRAREMAR